VLDNLLGNALKYTGRNGKIQILACGDDGNRCVFVSVGDDGEGIPDGGSEFSFWLSKEH